MLGPTRIARTAVGALVAAVVFAIGFTAAAWAGTATSAYGYYSEGGIDYRNYAAVNTNPSYNHQAYAVTLVSPRNTAAPAGWMGAAPRLYRNGSLYCAGTYTYNSSTVAQYGVLNPLGCVYYQENVWSSQGATRGWNGSSYGSWWTFMTPNQNS